tara:strand:- start:363 stop:557 length:195 start_codon:yes stop_codon:yes gene_type:complete
MSPDLRLILTKNLTLHLYIIFIEFPDFAVDGTKHLVRVLMVMNIVSHNQAGWITRPARVFNQTA